MPAASRRYSKRWCDSRMAEAVCPVLAYRVRHSVTAQVWRALPRRCGLTAVRSAAGSTGMVGMDSHRHNAPLGTIADAIVLSHVTKTFRGERGAEVTAIRDVSLAIPAGQFVAIVGESGSGKSTLMHCAAGLTTPTTGYVALAGTNLSALSSAKRSRFLLRGVLTFCEAEVLALVLREALAHDLKGWPELDAEAEFTSGDVLGARPLLPCHHLAQRRVIHAGQFVELSPRQTTRFALSIEPHNSQTYCFNVWIVENTSCISAFSVGPVRKILQRRHGHWTSHNPFPSTSSAA